MQKEYRSREINQFSVSKPPILSFHFTSSPETTWVYIFSLCVYDRSLSTCSQNNVGYITDPCGMPAIIEVEEV